MANGDGEKVMVDGEMAKRQGTRKRLFKMTTDTAVSTKIRIASALVSPRKRVASKPGARQGDMSKHMENGTSEIIILWIKLYKLIRANMAWLLVFVF